MNIKRIECLTLVIVLTLFLNACSFAESSSYGNDENIKTALEAVKLKSQLVSETKVGEVSELFHFDEVYYISVKIPEKTLTEDMTYKYTGDSYEIWRYENDQAKRILAGLDKVDYIEKSGEIIFIGAENSYIVKLNDEKNSEQNKGEILYECYFTNILNRDDGAYTCYINSFLSVCVVDNEKNELVLNQYLPEIGSYDDLTFYEKKDDFYLDNNKTFFRRNYPDIDEFGWIEDENIAYYHTEGMLSNYILLDMDREKVFNIKTYGKSFINPQKACIIADDSKINLDIIGFNQEQLKKNYSNIYLLNILTEEKIYLSKVFSPHILGMELNNNTFTYNTIFDEKREIDISNCIDKDRKNILHGFNSEIDSKYGLEKVTSVEMIKQNDIYYQTVKVEKNGNEFMQLYSMTDNKYEQVVESARNIDIHSHAGNLYAYIEDDANDRLISYMPDGSIKTINGSFTDIDFDDRGKYISLCDKFGNIILLDENSDIYYEDNIFASDTYDHYDESNIEDIHIKNSVWDENSENLYIFTEKDGYLANLFQVNVGDKSIKDYAENINCRYDNLYFDVVNKYALYTTYPYIINEDSSAKFDDVVDLCVEYLDRNEIVKIASVKGKEIQFTFNENTVNYSYNENGSRISYEYVIK